MPSPAPEWKGTAMSDIPSEEQLPDVGFGTEGPADSGADETGVPGEHDGGADGGADSAQ